MIQVRKLILAAVALLPVCASIAAAHAADNPPAATASGAATPLGHVVDGAIRPVLEKYRIPGMTVGIAAGEHSYVFKGTPTFTCRRRGWPALGRTDAMH